MTRGDVPGPGYGPSRTLEFPMSAWFIVFERENNNIAPVNAADAEEAISEGRFMIGDPAAKLKATKLTDEQVADLGLNEEE